MDKLDTVWGGAPWRQSSNPDFQAFATNYANWDGLKTVCVTIDQDWAPDYMTARVLEFLDDHRGPATIFATTDTPLLEKVAGEGHHEIGLHPNLMPGSTQGSDLASIVGGLRASFPDSRGTRFHLLGHSYRDLAWLSGEKFRYDVSSLRFNCPYLLPAWHPDLAMTMFSYTWEDAYEVDGRLPVTMQSVDLASPGIKILNFHPLTVYLNCARGEDRRRINQVCSDLSSCPEALARDCRSEGEGTETLLVTLLKMLSESGVRLVTMQEVEEAYRAMVSGAGR